MALPDPLSDFDERLSKLAGEAGEVTKPPEIPEEASRDIGALIEELHRNARKSREQVEAAERENQTLAAQLETTTAELQNARAREVDLRSRFVEITSLIKERDNAAAEVERHARTIAELKKQLEEATSGPADSGVKLTGTAAELSQAQKQITSIRQARDAAQTQVYDLNAKLSKAEDKIAELSDNYEVAQQATAQALEKLAELEKQFKVVESERSIHAEKVIQLGAQLQTERQQLLELLEEKSSPPAPDLSPALVEAQQQVEKLQHERDAERNRAEALAKEVEALALKGQAAPAASGGEINLAEQKKIQALEAELAEVCARERELEKVVMESRREQQEEDEALRRATRRGEEHRLMAIELASQLAAARRELMELGANLAEARLKVRSGAKTGNGGKGGAEVGDTAAPSETRSEGATEAVQKITDKEARDLLTAMRGCCLSFAKNPKDISLINELYSHAHVFSERARAAGMIAIHRLSWACAKLARHLYEIPESLNQSTMQTMQQTIEVLLGMVRDSHSMQIKDPASAKVYSVDDDINNCELMAAGLEIVSLPAVYSTDPDAALRDLASSQFDLIFLDLNMPGTNGFDLCASIRKLPNYAKTPIVFLTGQNTPETRAQSLTSGGSEFISKPFNVHEVNVKALTLIIKARLATP